MKNKNIVLLHGWAATSKKLVPLADTLQTLGWKAVTLQLPGFELPEPPEVMGIPEYSLYVSSEIKRYFKNESVFVFGHSFGGRIAMHLLSKNSPNINGAVLCAAAGISRGNAIKRYLLFVLAKMGKLLNFNTGLSNGYKKLLYKLARQHDYEKTSGIMKDIFKKVIAYDSRNDVPLVTKPILLLWGQKDTLTPIKDAYYLKRELKKAHLVKYPSEGHRLPYNQPNELANQINKWYETLN